MVQKAEKEPAIDEFSAALNKTWTRIGMGKVALANSLVGRPLFAPEEVSLLTNALIQSNEENDCSPTNIGMTGS
jgi:hypothetical protein